MRPRTSPLAHLALAGLLACAGLGRAEAPASANLAPLVAARIAHEDCRLLVIGDSLSVQETAPRWSGGIMRTWRPDRWVGRATSTVYGGTLDGSYCQNWSDQPRMRAVGVGERYLYALGTNNGPKMAFEGIYDRDILGQYVFKSPTLTHGTTSGFLGFDVGQYRGGDPFDETAVRARLIVYRDPQAFRNATGYVLLGARITREGWSTGALTTTDVDMRDQQRYPPGRIAFAEQAIPVAHPDYPIPRLLVMNRDERETGGMGEVTYGALYYAVDNAGKPLAGFSLDAVGNAGWRSGDWADRSGLAHVKDELFEDYLAATRAPNTFLIFLGTNDGPAGISAQSYRRSIENLLIRLVTLSERERVGLRRDELRFLLVAPYNVPNAGGLMGEYADALHAVALAPPAGLLPAQVGFINLYRLYGGENPMRDGADRVHPETTEEADDVTRRLWKPIEGAARRLPGAIGPNP